MNELIRQAVLDRLNNDFEQEENVVDAIIDYYVRAQGEGNKLISHIIHDIWRFGGEDGQHFLFEGRLLTRSVWDLVSKTRIMPQGDTEVFIPRITSLVAGAQTFRQLVSHHLLGSINLQPDQALSFTNMLLFMREFSQFAQLPDMLQVFTPHLKNINSEMGKSQVTLSAIITNLGISDLQFVKGMIISSILITAAIRDDIDVRTPFDIAVDVVRALQRQYAAEAVRDEAFNYRPFTLLSKRVRQVQPREMLLIETNFGRHMQEGYEYRLMTGKQSQFDVTQDTNKLTIDDERTKVSISMIRTVRDRIATQVGLYTAGASLRDDDEIMVVVGMVLQLPQQENVRINNQASDVLMAQVGGSILQAQQIIQEQLMFNEGWSKYVTLTFIINWVNDIDQNEEMLRDNILARIEALINQYGSDEYAQQLLMNGLDSAVLRKLIVRPMVYIAEALRRPAVVTHLGRELREPHQPIIQPVIASIIPALEAVVLLIDNQISDNRLQTEALQLQHLNQRQEMALSRIDRADEEEEQQEQDANDMRNQWEAERLELAEIEAAEEEEAEKAYLDNQEQWRIERSQQVQESQRLQAEAEAFRLQMLIPRHQQDEDYNYRPMADAEDEDEDDFGQKLVKKPRYFSASRPSDLLFEKIFNLQPQTSGNCVVNTFQALVRVFPETNFIISDNFFDLFNQLYQKTSTVGESLRHRLRLCEYENTDMPLILRNLLSDKRLEFIVFYRQGHAFPCIVQMIADKQASISAISEGISQKSYEPMIFTSRSASVRKGLGSKDNSDKAMKDAYTKRRANVYFDFETTLSEDPHHPKHQGLQQAFLVSLTIDILIPLKEITQILFGDDQDGIEDVHLFIPFELIWGIDCDVELITRFHSIQDFIREGCQPFNDLIDIRAPKHPKMSDVFNAISFNGSKFDNQFIVKGLVKIYNEAWYKQVQIVGNLNDIKVMIYKGIHFIDLRLMCGASSLDQFCKDMQIDLESSKKKIDYAKMRTFELATQNREEIESYCAHDTISLRELHIKVQTSLRDLVVSFVKEYSSVSPQQIFTNTAKIFTGWVTISQLSLKIFRNVFCDQAFRASRNHAVLSVYRDSYKGGYTQAFILGETPADQQVYYMDFNSMYPFIMASTPFPVDMSQSEVFTRESEVVLTENNFYQWTSFQVRHQVLVVDPFTKLFSLKLEYQHFDVFQLRSFEFTKDCKAPSFGVIVKGRGTIYPRTFKASSDAEEVNIFGFQLQESFNLGILVSASFKRSVEFVRGNTVARPIFKTFDDFMFKARTEFKNAKNTSMSTAVKLLINSLYGKFGQRQHDVEFFASTSDIEDGDTFENLLRDNTVDRDDIQLTPEGLTNANVRVVPLVDVNGTPMDVSRVILSGTESLDNDVGSFVLIASLITAIGRQMITNIINTSTGDVYYSDTDSVMMNQKAFEHLQNGGMFPVSDSQFGALKNEYPLGGNSNLSAITQIRVLNKKIYQLNVNGSWISKFKGCTRPTSEIFDNFMMGGMHQQLQTRFIKNTASVCIQERNMRYRLRLSREVVQHLDSQYADTIPFESVETYQAFYPSSKSYIHRIQGVWTPYQIA